MLFYSVILYIAEGSIRRLSFRALQEARSPVQIPLPEPHHQSPLPQPPPIAVTAVASSMSDAERTQMHELLDRAERRIAHLEREARSILNCVTRYNCVGDVLGLQKWGWKGELSFSFRLVSYLKSNSVEIYSQQGLSIIYVYIVKHIWIFTRRLFAISNWNLITRMILAEIIDSRDFPALWPANLLTTRSMNFVSQVIHAAD